MRSHSGSEYERSRRCNHVFWHTVEYVPIFGQRFSVLSKKWNNKHIEKFVQRPTTKNPSSCELFSVLDVVQEAELHLVAELWKFRPNGLASL